MGRHESVETVDQIAERWLDVHGDALFRFAVSRGLPASEAEDAVQETLIEGLRKLDTFEARSSEKTWLIGILRYKILEAMRRRAKDSGREPAERFSPPGFDAEGHWRREDEPEGMDWNPNPRETLSASEFMDTLHQCVSKLPSRAADAFVMREIDQYDTSQILDTLEISESNLWTLLHRARHHLRLCIKRNWFDVRDT